MSAARRIPAGVPTRACLLSIALAAACLSYNVTMEAKARGVPISDVSIVASAERRLSLEEVAGPKRQQLVVWSRLIGRQSQTLLRSLQPWRRVDRIGNGGAASIAASLLLLAAALAFAWTREPCRRKPLLVMALAGPVWIFAMRDLSSFHAYVGLFYFPFALVLFMGLLHVLPARTHLAVVLIACSLGVWGTYRKNELLTRVSRITNQETADMQRIAGKLRDERRVTGVPKHRKLFPGVPFALGFYFPNHDVLVEGRSNLVISRDPEFDGTNLTPYNRHLFLYHMERAYRVRTALGGRRVHEKNQLAHQLRVLRDKGRRKKSR